MSRPEPTAAQDVPAGDPAAGNAAVAVDRTRWALPADEATFRRAVGRFGTGVCVLSTVCEGMDHAMTVNAFTSVSLEPLLVLVCVETEARFYDAVIESGQWAISVLDATARPAATWLATRGRPLDGQLEHVPHHRGPVTGSALLEQASAWLECRTHAIHPGGDHVILVGEVLSAGLGPVEHGALIYHRGEYRFLP